MDLKCMLIPLLVLLAISALLIVILVPSMFGDLEFNEMGFVRNKATGTVDTSKVYFGGRHTIGVTKDFKKFKTSQYHLQFADISVYNQEKLEITLSCSLQYVLRPEDLVTLHDVYDVHYEPIIRGTALASIKGAAVVYSMDQFRLNRTFVASGLEKAVSLALDGGCCRKDCINNKCVSGCKRYELCKSTEKGMYSALTGFQLKLVGINYEQTKRFMQTVVEQEREDTEAFKQIEKVTRKKIEEQKAKINNEADEISQNAAVQSTLIRTKADIDAKATVASARNQGLSIIHKKLNITDEEQKKTLDYVRTLRDHEDVNMYIGFQYMVAKP